MSDTITAYDGSATAAPATDALSPSAVDTWSRALADNGLFPGGSGDNGWGSLAGVGSGRCGAGAGVPTSTGAATAAGVDGLARPAVDRSNTGGFDPGGVRLMSASGGHPEDGPHVGHHAGEEDLPTPGHHAPYMPHVPQIVPGLNSPFPTVPILGGGRGPVSPAPRPAVPSGQAPGPADSRLPRLDPAGRHPPRRRPTPRPPKRSAAPADGRPTPGPMTSPA